MNEAKAKPGNGGRRGGGSSVALLFVAAAFSAAAVFALTRVFLSNADGIAQFVPANAVAYLHAGGRGAVNAVLSASVQMPSGVSPDEIAVFATPGDEALRWGVIAAWRAPKYPTPADRAALGARDAATLDARHFLIGDGSLAIASRVAAAAHASLYDDAKRRDALAAMRSVAAIQAYADPAALLARDALAAFPGPLEEMAAPLVAGINLGGPTAYARIMTVSDAAARSSWLGYHGPSGGGRHFDLGRFQAQVALAEETPSFDLAKLFSGMPDAKGHPMPSLLAEAADAMRSELARPYSLWLRPGAATGGIDYLLRIDGTPPAVIGKAMARYAATINPDRAVLHLPDGDTAMEFRLDEAARADKMGTDDAAIALDAKTGGAVAIGSDGLSSTLLASSEKLIAEYRAENRTSARPDDDACPGGGNLRAVIDLRDPNVTVSAVPQLMSVVRMLNLKRIRIGLTVDDEITACGYK
ncbi:MAG: hypothetical protein RL272_644 [Candidatus Parcubacteria bacterium]